MTDRTPPQPAPLSRTLRRQCIFGTAAVIVAIGTATALGYWYYAQLNARLDAVLGCDAPRAVAAAQLTLDRQSIDRLMTAGCRLVNTVVVVSFLVLAAAAGWIMRAVFDRIDVVSEAFGRLAAGNLKTRLACSSRDEIGVLSRRFNELASSLEGRRRQEPAAAAKNPPATASDPQPQAPCRVLVAEDGPENRRFISLVLKKTGAEVTLAENGSEAVEKALAGQQAGRPFDLILMDMQMPVLDGFEATRRLRQQGYAGQITAVTALTESYDRQTCLEAGCDSYFAKPLDRETLVSMVAGLQRSSASARQSG